MSNLYLLKPPETEPDSEMVEMLERLLAAAKDGKLSSLVVGYTLDIGAGEPPLLTTDGAGATTERIALAALIFRAETDDD